MKNLTKAVRDAVLAGIFTVPLAASVPIMMMSNSLRLDNAIRNSYYYNTERTENLAFTLTLIGCVNIPAVAAYATSALYHATRKEE
jgi:hypothetical protein